MAETLHVSSPLSLPATKQDTPPISADFNDCPQASHETWVSDQLRRVSEMLVNVTLNGRSRPRKRENAIAFAAAGKMLLRVKNRIERGQYFLTLRSHGISTETAKTAVRIDVALDLIENSERLFDLGTSKLVELTLAKHRDSLRALANGEQVGGVVLEDLVKMRLQEFRLFLRLLKHDEERVELLSRSTALRTGDRIESHLTKRPGSVVKVYPDGSACVLWDDGEPQPEGMGHERVPRDCLVLRASAKAPAPDLEGGELEAFGHGRSADSNPDLVQAMAHGSKPEPEAPQTAERADTADALARRKAYLEARMRTLLRFVEEAELNMLEDTLDDLVGDITRRRFVPGLVAEDYALTHRFLVAGGVQ